MRGGIEITSLACSIGTGKLVVLGLMFFHKNAITLIQQQVLNNHIDMSILLNLGYTCPDSTQEEIRVLREARELQRSVCFRTLLGAMAQGAIDQNCDIEPLFESFANVTYDTEGSVSGEETSDD